MMAEEPPTSERWVHCPPGHADTERADFHRYDLEPFAN